jgi:hypothetical protein
MAMKPCLECGKEISTRAKTCPNCGNRHPTSSMSRGAKVGLGLLAFVAFVWVVGTVSVAMDDSVSYSVVERWGNGLGRAILIDPADRSPERLRQLCDEIKADRRNASHATVLVYDDRTAAGLRHDERMETADAFPEHDAHLVASYTKNGTTGFHECTIMAEGAMSESSYEKISY